MRTLDYRNTARENRTRPTEGPRPSTRLGAAMVRTRHLAISLSIFLIQHTARPTRRWRIWSAEESWGCRMLWNVMTADEPEPEPSFHSVYPSANSTLIRGSWFPSEHDPEAPRTTTPTDGSAFFCSLSLEGSCTSRQHLGSRTDSDGKTYKAHVSHKFLAHPPAALHWRTRTKVRVGG